MEETTIVYNLDQDTSCMVTCKGEPSQHSGYLQQMGFSYTNVIILHKLMCKVNY